MTEPDRGAGTTRSVLRPLTVVEQSAGGKRDACDVQVAVDAALQETFKLASLRDGQEVVIQAVLEGRDALFLAPTGGGKSLCYQLPAVVLHQRRRAFSVVICPLLALMQNQLDTLHRLGIKATSISSTQTVSHNRDALQQIAGEALDSDELCMIYVTPETAASHRFLDALEKAYRRKAIGLFAVDEAHNIHVWGHDFRKKYRQLGELKQRFPRVPILAVSATATKKVREDIRSQLQIPGALQIVRSFNRPNIQYDVRYLFGDVDRLRLRTVVEVVTAHAGSCGLVYARTRELVELVTLRLNAAGIKVGAYHAGMSTNKRFEVQSKWQSGELPVVVATLAFGMGIDKGDVRYIVHADMPATVDAFYQQSGRAGRDLKPAVSILLFSADDVRRLFFTIDSAIYASDTLHERAVQELEDIRQMFTQNVCRRKLLLAHFGEALDLTKRNFVTEKCCDVCANPGAVQRSIAQLRGRVRDDANCSLSNHPMHGGKRKRGDGDSVPDDGVESNSDNDVATRNEADELLMQGILLKRVSTPQLSSALHALERKEVRRAASAPTATVRSRLKTRMAQAAAAPSGFAPASSLLNSNSLHSHRR